MEAAQGIPCTYSCWQVWGNTWQSRAEPSWATTRVSNIAPHQTNCGWEDGIFLRCSTSAYRNTKKDQPWHKWPEQPACYHNHHLSVVKEMLIRNRAPSWLHCMCTPWRCGAYSPQELMCKDLASITTPSSRVRSLVVSWSLRCSLWGETQGFCHDFPKFCNSLSCPQLSYLPTTLTDDKQLIRKLTAEERHVGIHKAPCVPPAFNEAKSSIFLNFFVFSGIFILLYMISIIKSKMLLGVTH